MTKSNKFSPEVRERAVRMVQENRGEYPLLWAAIKGRFSGHFESKITLERLTKACHRRMHVVRLTRHGEKQKQRNQRSVVQKN